jgi:hypothetical protein
MATATTAVIPRESESGVSSTPRPFWLITTAAEYWIARSSQVKPGDDTDFFQRGESA